MKLSIVTTLYQSASYIQEFYQRATASAQKFAGDDYELIFVNDGSPDNSFEIVVELAEHDDHIMIIDLSRNFGHHKAMMTGLAYTAGEKVFLLDSDLEEEPEWLISFGEQMELEGWDSVYGVQKKRRGNLSEQILGNLFYRLFRFLTDVEQPDNIVTARLMTQRYVKALLQHQERELNIGGLWIITGFQQTSQAVLKKATSPTTYSLSRKVSHLINAVTSFSSKPLVFTFYSGLLISLTAFVFIAYLVICYFFIATVPDGYTSIVASIWLFSGLIIFFLGIQGIYISKVFLEVKQRPYTIVRAIHPPFKGKN